jgi:hypothetical protein
MGQAGILPVETKHEGVSVMACGFTNACFAVSCFASVEIHGAVRSRQKCPKPITEPKMIKTLLTSAALVVCFSTASQAASMMACTNKNIMKMEHAAMAMNAPGQKHDMAMAMDAVHMAQMSKKEHKTHDCQMHLDEAMKMADHK